MTLRMWVKGYGINKPKESPYILVDSYCQMVFLKCKYLFSNLLFSTVSFSSTSFPLCFVPLEPCPRTIGAQMQLQVTIHPRELAIYSWQKHINYYSPHFPVLKNTYNAQIWLFAITVVQWKCLTLVNSQEFRVHGASLVQGWNVSIASRGLTISVGEWWGFRWDT